jgi:hypothetical protein
MMLVSFACPVIFAIPSATGFMAKSQGKSFWLWFGLAFLLPVISTIYLWTQLDKKPDTSE